MKRKYLLLLILFLPSVGAQTQNPVEVVQWYEQIHHRDGANDGTTGPLAVAGMERQLMTAPTNHTILELNTTIHIYSTYSFNAGGAFRANYNFQVNESSMSVKNLTLGGINAACSWDLTTVAVGVGEHTYRDMPTYHVACQNQTALDPGGIYRFRIVDANNQAFIFVGSATTDVIVEQQAKVEVQLMSEFEITLGLKAIELFSLFGLLALGLLVNAMGKDLGSKMAGATILMFLALVAATIRTVWPHGLIFTIATFLLAGYAYFRSGVSVFKQGRTGDNEEEGKF